MNNFIFVMTSFRSIYYYFRFTVTTKNTFTVKTAILYITEYLTDFRFTVQSPPRIIKQPPTDELLFQVKSRADENDKPFIIECEADGEPTPQ